MKKKLRDPIGRVRERMARAFRDSGLTQQEVGERMGLDASDARKAVSRLLTSRIDPRISTLIKFADALERKPTDFFQEND